jgi:dolichol kinase
MADSSDDVAEIPFRAEVARKALHLIALVIPVTSLLIGRPYAIGLLVPLAIIAVSADVIRARSHVLNGFITKYLGFMMRPSETPGVGSPVVLNGATCVLLSAAILAILFPLRIGMTAFIVFMISDAAAALVGRRMGRIRWPGSRRTIEGSIAFVITGTLLYVAWIGTLHWAILAVVIIGAIAEAVPRPFNDNIRVPLVMGLTMYLLSLFVALPNSLLIS